MLLGASSMSHVYARPPWAPLPADRPSKKVSFRIAVVEHIMGGLMANREQSQTISEQFLAFEEEQSTRTGETEATFERRVGFWSRFLHHEWVAAALYLFLDVVSWIAIYRIAGW